MVKRIQEYVRYTTEELDNYANTPGSCVIKVNKTLHMAVGAHCLGNFKQALGKHITRLKVGHYDTNLGGIILDLKNIKVLSPLAALRADDHKLHMDINADCYVFRPVAGAMLTGIVKHIGMKQLGVIIYRVFSVNIRLNSKLQYDEVQMDQQVEFRIRTFNLQNVLPYIEGELKIRSEELAIENGKSRLECDSGIENNVNELDSLIDTLKHELSTEGESSLAKEKKKKKDKDKEKHRHRKRKSSETDSTPVKIKREMSEDS